MRLLTLALSTTFALALPVAAFANQGILLLAHNGPAEWTAQVRTLAAKVDSKKPADVAFGLPTRASIGSAIDRLAKRGATEVTAVPLFLSEPVSPDALSGHSVNVGLAPAAPDDPVFAESVLRLATETSRQQGGEVLILIGYGGDDAGARWSVDLMPWARRLNLTRRFGSILTIPRPDRFMAVQQKNFRGVLEKSLHPGRPIVVVSLIPLASGPGSSIEPILKGFTYATASRGVLSDDAVVQWVLAQASASKEF